MLSLHVYTALFFCPFSILFFLCLKNKSPINDTLELWFIETVWNRWIHTPNPSPSRLSHTLDYKYMPTCAVYFYFLVWHMLLNITKSVLRPISERRFIEIQDIFCMLFLSHVMRLRYILVCLFVFKTWQLWSLSLN